MSSPNQIFLAFAIPLCSALGLFLVRMAVFPGNDFYRSDLGIHTGNEPLFAPADVPWVVVKLFEYFAFGLLALALILPFFVMTRTYRSRRNKLESPSIFE